MPMDDVYDERFELDSELLEPHVSLSLAFPGVEQYHIHVVVKVPIGGEWI